MSPLGLQAGGSFDCDMDDRSSMRGGACGRASRQADVRMQFLHDPVDYETIPADSPSRVQDSSIESRPETGSPRSRSPDSGRWFGGIRGPHATCRIGGTDATMDMDRFPEVVGCCQSRGGGARSMCGICGAVWTDPNGALTAESLQAMMDRIVHRGPDDAGVYRDNHAALGFRRLSIIDLAGGHQPLSNEDGTVWTVFNGEIYNFPRCGGAWRPRGTRFAPGRHRGPRSPVRGRGNAGCSAVCAGCSPWRSGTPPAALWSWPATGWARSR